MNSNSGQGRLSTDRVAQRLIPLVNDIQVMAVMVNEMDLWPLIPFNAGLSYNKMIHQGRLSACQEQESRYEPPHTRAMTAVRHQIGKVANGLGKTLKGDPGPTVAVWMRITPCMV